MGKLYQSSLSNRQSKKSNFKGGHKEK